MADRKTPKQAAQGGGNREDRLKAALKANLARRKAQRRERAGDVRAQGFAETAQQNTKGQEKDA